MTLKELLGDKYNSEMSAEDIFSAVSGIDLKTSDDISALNEQIEAYKKKERDAMNAEERIKADNDEIAKELAEARKKISRYEQERKFISGGFDEKTASKLAQYVSDGDMDGFMKTQSEWMKSQKTAMESQIKSDLMGQMQKTQQDGNFSDEEDEGEDVKIAKELASSSMAANKALDAYYGNKA